MKRLIVAISTLLAIVLIPFTLSAITIHIPGDYSTIQEGIDEAEDGYIVLVADGTYTGDGNQDIDFTGKAIVVISENGPEVTIIDCNGSASDPHRGFYFHSGENSTSILSGFKIINGYVTGSLPEENYGGGIYCSESSPTITNCTVSGNTAVYSSGGIYCSNSNPTIENCTISGNSAGSHGGGIYCYESSPTISNCTLSENSVTVNGGGIYCCYNSSPTILNCTISGNSVTDGGGGIYCWYSSSPTISNCNISGNMAGNGGGIGCHDYSSPIIENCNIIGNSVNNPGGGGIYCYYYCSPTIENCVISGNSADEWGGGIWIRENSNPTIKNCVLSGNSAVETGGGIDCWGSSPIIENCTISENSAWNGGGIYCSSSSPTGVNNIIWANTALTGSQIYVSSPGSFTCTYSDIQGGWPGEGNIDADPLFTPGPLGDYYLSQPEGGQPPPLSPCVDAGDAPVPPNSGTTCTNQGYDLGIIDMGYHYPHIEDLPLPVEMTLFTAIGGDSKVTLHWVTASELDNDHFNLYKSEIPEGGFRLIAQVEGSGTSVSEQEYFYSDNQVINGFTYYYRISDVDINGTEEFYPETISAIPGGEGVGVVADNFGLHHSYPNPFNSSANISFNILTSGMVRLSVYNEQGAEVTVIMDSYCEPGAYTRQFIGDNLASGVYFVNLKQGDLTSVSRLVLLR